MISCETRPGIYHNVLWYLIQLSISVLLIQPLVCRFIKTLIYVPKTTKINYIHSTTMIFKAFSDDCHEVHFKLHAGYDHDDTAKWYLISLLHSYLMSFLCNFFLFDYKYWMGWFLLEVKDISIPVCWRTKLILLILFCFHTPGSEKVKSW